MRILDTYISKKFLGALIFTLVAFFAIFIIIDLIDRLGDFLSHDVPKIIIFEYYLYYLPFILVLILPVAILLSCLFSIGGLAKNNELVAMKASGQSLQRILLPLFVLGLVISLLMIYFGERVVPFTNQKMYNIERVYLHKHTHFSQRRSNIFYKDNVYNDWIYIGHYDHRLHKAHNISIQHVL
ncbi:LptF/LptG family permease, partial [candidate division KSB1 bacterium]|nr:LptF/LptG family permease [candidate division KSB1 bacterium]